MVPGPYLNAQCRTLVIFSEQFGRELKFVLDGLHTFSKYFLSSFVCIIGVSISFTANEIADNTSIFFFAIYFLKKKWILVSIGVLCKVVPKTASVIKCSGSPFVI